MADFYIVNWSGSNATPDSLYLVDSDNPDNTTSPYGLQGSFPTGLTSVGGITSYDGALWVTDGQGDELWKIDPTDPDRTTGGYGNQGSFNFGLTEPFGITSYDGALWVTDSQGDELWKIDPTDPDRTNGGYGNQGSFNSGLTSPLGITSYDGALWVVDSGGDELWKIDPTDPDRTTGGYGNQGPFNSGLGFPNGITSHDGALWVIDGSTNNGELWKIDPTDPDRTNGGYGNQGSFGSGLTSPGGITFHVTPTNPTADITTVAQTIDAGATLTLALTAGHGGDGQTLTYLWSATGGTFNSTSAQNPVWTAPSPTGETEYTLTARVTDTDNNFVEDTVTITVRATPTDPTASITTAAQTIDAGSTLTLALTAGHGGDGQTLTYLWSATGGTFNSTSAQNPVWTAPSPTGETEYTLTARVTDTDSNFVEDTVTITVRAAIVTVLLVLSDFGGTGVAEINALIEAGSEGTTVYATSQRPPATGSLLDGDLSLSSDSVPFTRIRILNSGARLAFNDNSSLFLSTYFSVDGADLTIWVQTGTGDDEIISFPVDGNIFTSGGGFINFNVDTLSHQTLLNGISDGDRFIIAMTREEDDDTVPTIATISDQTGKQDSQYTTQTLPVATDGNSPYTYSVSGLPTGLTFDDSTRQISGTPTVHGTFEITYTVTDDDGDEATATFDIVVAQNLTPTAPDVSDQEVDFGEEISITLPVGSGGDGDLSYDVIDEPSWISFNSNTRVLSGTSDSVETTTVTYRVTDDDGDSDDSTFDIVVSAIAPGQPNAPTIEARQISDSAISLPAIPDQTVKVGDYLSIQLPASNLSDGVEATWSHSTDTGGSSITGSNIRYRLVTTGGSGAWTTTEGVTSPYDIADLDPGATYEVQVQSVNSVGVGDWSESGEGDSSSLGGDDIYYLVGLLPDDLVFHSDSRIISGTLSPNSDGTYMVSFVVVNDDQMDDSDFTITVSAATAPDNPSAPQLHNHNFGLRISWEFPDNGGNEIISLDMRWRKTGESWNNEDDILAPISFMLIDSDDVEGGEDYEAQTRFTNGIGTSSWSSSGTVTTREEGVVTPIGKYAVEADWSGDGRYSHGSSDLYSRLIKKEIKTDRGRNYASQVFGRTVAGGMNLTLRDEDGLYDSLDVNSPLYRVGIEGTSVRLRMNDIDDSSVWHNLWSGKIDNSDPKQKRGGQDEMVFSCKDIITDLSKTSRSVFSQKDDNRSGCF